MIHLGDCIEVLRTLPDAFVDAVVTDPPYELGFMGKRWDASGIAYSIALWTEALRVLKPGGHLLAFGGTRTYHRMACAIEDAGFEVRDSLHWIYGSGFPKSLNVGDGWGTALKPAHEPVVVARKPLVGTVAANVQEYGTGALNIDGCRVASGPSPSVERRKHAAPGESIGATGWTTPARPPEYNEQRLGEQFGRWPPNILLSHTPECGEACAEGCPVAELDQQSGPAGSNSMSSGKAATGGAFLSGIGGNRHLDTRKSGGASRFFPVFRYQAKASRSERERGLNEGQKASHPTVKPVELMRWLVRLVTPPGGVVLDPFTGSGTTGMACVLEGFRFIGIEREPEYHAIATARVEHAKGQQPAQAELFGGAS